MSLHLLVIKPAATCEYLLEALDRGLHEVDQWDITQDFMDIHVLQYAAIIIRIDVANQQRVSDFTQRLHQNADTRYVPIIAYIPDISVLKADMLDQAYFADVLAPIHREEFTLLSRGVNAISRRYNELASMVVSASVLGIDLDENIEKNTIVFLLSEQTRNTLSSPMLERLEELYHCHYFSTPDAARKVIELETAETFIVDATIGREALKFASMLANRKIFSPVLILNSIKEDALILQSMEIRSQGILMLEANPYLYLLKIAATLRWVNQYNYFNRQLDKQLHLSQRDDLTALFNRRYMNRYTEKLLEQASVAQHPFCLCLADIDHFKSINNHYGHLIGDEVLKSLAETLRSRVRLQDVVGRWGGEEFVIIFSNLNPNLGSILVDRVRLYIEECPFHSSLIADGASITISIGFSSSRPGDTLQRIVDRADKALYVAKQQGRNRVICYEDIAQD